MVFPAVFNMSTLNGQNGFVLDGINQFDDSGGSVSGAGDVNHDGIDDIIIGAQDADGFVGQAYIVFGRKYWQSDNSLSDSFIINSNHNIGGHVGVSVSGAGDINGDSIDDFIIGSMHYQEEGQIFVIFGSSRITQQFKGDLTTLNGTNGFILNGVDSTINDVLVTVAYTGDVNSDGINDISIGVPAIGQSYIVFGSKSSFPASVNLSALNGQNGFNINGTNQGNSGHSISGAGDINADGIDDIIIGAPDQNEAYLIFGSKSSFPASVDLSSLNGNNGFVISSSQIFGLMGSAVSGAGDINHDGIDDFIIGAPGENVCNSYVIYGNKNGFTTPFDIVDIDGTNGFIVDANNLGDGLGASVSGIGDMNGDGISDIAIVAFNAAQIYVVFGSKYEFPLNINSTWLDGNRGFVINVNGFGLIRNIGDDDNAIGVVANRVGDVNSDGIDDLIIGYGSYDNAGQSYVIFGQNATQSYGDLES